MFVAAFELRRVVKENQPLRIGSGCCINDRLNDHKHYWNRFDGMTRTGWQEVPESGTTQLPDGATTFNNAIYMFGIGIVDGQHYMNVLPE